MTDGALPGRDQLYKLIWSELLKRVDKGAQRPLPVVVLGGPRGSGKTSMLDLLTVRCRQQDLQPFVPALNLEQGTFGDRGWQVIDWIARQLGGQSWPTFGRLRFPRFALGRIIVEGAVDVRTLQQTQDDIARLLRQASGLEQIAAGLNNIARQLPDQLLGIPTGASSLRLVGVVGARLVNSQLAAKLRFHTGMAFYGKVMASQANGGFNALAALSQLRLSNGDAARSTVNEMLCRAFLADLAEAYRRGFHPRNCLVLVDNLDSADGGKELITALVKAKSEAAPEKPDPLLLVATSRRTTALSPLLTADAPDVPVEQHFYPDRMVRVSDFDPRPGAQRSWLYPVRLTDLDQRTVEKLAVSLYPARVDLAAFVFSLTRGHPWSVVQTLATLNALAQESARQLDEHELRAVLDSPCPGAGRKLGDHAVEYLLLEDLDQPLRSLMPACAAAVDVVTAQRTRLAPRPCS